MKFTAQQIATVLGGEVVGNTDVEVSKLAKIEEGTPGSISFLSNPKYESYLYTTQSTITIVNKTFVATAPLQTTLILVDDAYLSFTTLLEFYDKAKKGNKKGIMQPSYMANSASYGTNFYLGNFSHIEENVVIGNDVSIYPNCYIGENVVLGNNVTIFAGAKIHSDSIIGNNCVVYTGAIIGADGFGFAPQADGSYKKIPQIGNVILEDDVDVGANTTIDKATMGSTIIKSGVKLDNLIQIGHNVEIGKNTVIAAQTGIAGSTKIGENCMIGGQVGIAGHLKIGNNVRIQAQSGIGRNLKDNEILQGSPAFGYSDFSKSFVHFKNLPKTMIEFEKIKKEIENNKNKNNG